MGDPQVLPDRNKSNVTHFSLPLPVHCPTPPISSGTTFSQNANPSTKERVSEWLDQVEGYKRRRSGQVYMKRQRSVAAHGRSVPGPGPGNLRKVSFKDDSNPSAPGNGVMLLPASPGVTASQHSGTQTSSPPRKRKRSTTAPSKPDRRSSSAVSTNTTDTGFTARTRLQIENLSSGIQCWHCGDRDTDIAHVIDKGERTVSACLMLANFSTRD